MEPMDLFAAGSGVNMTGVTTTRAGIPGRESKWHYLLHKPDNAWLFGHYAACTDGKKLYHQVNGELNISIDVETGQHHIIDDVGEINRMDSQIAISGNGILFGNILYDRTTLCRVHCFELLMNKQVLLSGPVQTINPVSDGFLYLSGINKYRKLPEVLYHVDTQNLVAIPLEQNYHYALPYGDSTLFVSQGYGLSCINWRTGEVIWDRELLPDYHKELSAPMSSASKRSGNHLCCTADILYVRVGYDAVYRLCSKTGMTLASYPLSSRSRRYGNEDTFLFVADDICYIMHYDDMRSCSTAAYTINDDKLLFQVENKSNEYPLFIAGDMIMYSDSDKYHFLLRDRYNGEIVWTSSDFIGLSRYGLAVGNKFFIYSYLGRSICYEWDEPYVSPDRPNTAP